MQKLVAILALTVLSCAAQAASTVTLPDFREIVRETSPAVVKIIVEHSSPRSNGPQSQEIPEYLRRFFEHRGAPQGQRPSMGTGSGFVIDEDGYIVTNNHVVEGADSILVRFSNRSEYEAELIGTDPRSDLALLKIDESNLPELPVAKDDALEVGEWVLAIGSPFGLDYSVTAGIVSAKGRSLPTERNENYVPFIQTDVAINPGNSGGPLFNLAGEVVGVNSQIFTRSGGSIGLSFAIPASVLRNVVGQLRDTGHVTRGWLGVSIQDVNTTLAESFGLERPKGALVTQLAEDGPAAEAGIEAGDVIVSFDGNEILTPADLPHVVGLIRPGTKVSLELIRDKKLRKLKVEVGGLDADETPSVAGGSQQGESGGRLGISVTEPSKDMLENWGISGGALVRGVEPGSVAAEAGILSGDVITMIGSTPIKNVSTLGKAVEELKTGASVPVRLIRRGSPLFIGIKLQD